MRWYWYLLILILLPVVIAILKISRVFVRYHFLKGKYAHLHRHPLLCSAIYESGDTTGKLVDIWTGLQRTDGTFEDVSNLGPYMDGTPYVMVSDRDALKEIFLSKTEFPKAMVSYNLFKDLLGNGLVMSDGPLWKSQRSLIQPFFHLASLKSLHQSMVDLTQKFIDKIEAGGPEKLHPAKDLFVSHSMAVIITLAFGSEMDDEWLSALFKQINLVFNGHVIGQIFLERLWKYVPYYGTIMKKLVAELRPKIQACVDKRRQAEPQPDLIGHLAQAVSEDGQPLPIDLVLDECATFIFAGSDTSASTLSWIGYYLSTYPEVQTKLQAEVDTELQGRTPTYDDIQHLKYCHAILNETLRIQPVVPMIDRVTTKEMEVAGKFIPKGTVIGLGIYPLHHNPKYWPEPERFIPERWDKLERQSFTWTPFSAGHRNCIGSKFAENEIVLTLAMLAQRFNISHDPSKKIISVFEGVVTPVGLELKFTKRK